MLVVLIAPLFGSLLYISCGEGRPARKMSKRMEKAKACNEQAERAFFGERETDLAQTREAGTSAFLWRQAGSRAYFDGEVVYYDSGEKAFASIMQALENAKRFILLEYFIIAHGKMWGDILKILLKKAEEGVQVRIIYDDFGCMTTLPPRYDRYLESLNPNLRCLSFNNVAPIFSMKMNNRDHRKILVVDGETAFTGGFNLADEYIGEKRRFGHWKDSGLQITGGGVNAFTRMFFDVWNAFRRDKEDLKKYLILPVKADMPPSNGVNSVLQPYASSPLDAVSVGEFVYVDMIERASKYIYVFTPYLILDDFTRRSLCRAAMRGVDVRIVTPSIPDKKTVFRLTRANYKDLMKAGVRIYEYTPGFIHAKSMLCDGEYAVVGTINLDYRSLYLHFEDGVYFANCSAVADLKRDCEATFALSKLCTNENMKRSLVGRFIDSLLRIFETLL
jgi:cardiolipin synthase